MKQINAQLAQMKQINAQLEDKRKDLALMELQADAMQYDIEEKKKHLAKVEEMFSDIRPEMPPLPRPVKVKVKTSLTSSQEMVVYPADQTQEALKRIYAWAINTGKKSLAREWHMLESRMAQVEALEREQERRTKALEEREAYVEGLKKLFRRLDPRTKRELLAHASRNLGAGEIRAFEDFLLINKEERRNDHAAPLPLFGDRF